MQPFTNALLETFALRRSALVDALSHIIHNNPYQEPGVFYRSDMEQMLDGAVVLLKEALLGADVTVRTRFLEHILPGMMLGGAPADGLMHMSYAWSAFLTTEIDRHIGADYRDATRTWLTDFLGGWLTAMAKIAAEAESRLPA